MIEKMNKYTMILHHSSLDTFLEELRNIGVSHIDVNEADIQDDERIEKGLSQLSELKSQISFLQTFIGEEDDLQKASKGVDIKDVLSKIVELKTEKDKIASEILSLEKDVEQLEEWGDYDGDKLQALTEAGWKLRCFHATINSFDEAWIADYNAHIVSQEGSKINFVTLTLGEQEFELECEEFKLPEYTLGSRHAELRERAGRTEKIDAELKSLAQKHINDLELLCKTQEEQIDFESVRKSSSLVAENKINVVEAWIPAVNKQEMETFLNAKPLVYESKDATPGEDAPVKLKNNKFAELCEPIAKLYMLPKYGELDATPFFAPFFVMFFGFCLGDAGYGLLMLLALVFVLFKTKDLATKKILYLGIFLGISTVIFGILTGTFFGIFLADVSFPALDRFKDAYLNSNELMMLSLAVGAVQMLFGMTLNVVNKTRMRSFRYAISSLSWFLLLASSAASAGYMYFAKGEFMNLPYMIIAGLSLIGIFFLNTPGKGIFTNIGAGLWDTYNMVVGTVGDLLSYIRLFALGVASGLLGNAFNQIAMTCLNIDVPGLDILLMLIVLLVGHGINIFMSLIGSFVHPLRLTFVEFYKAIGFQGGGKAYKPFRKMVTTEDNNH
ncbi:MAG: V-type ATP synthase subunit I [Bacteroidales bacterium]